MPKVNGAEVTAHVSTKDRYFTTLPSCLLALVNQTVTPKKLLIYDDGEHIDLRQVSIYRNIFAMLDIKGIEWEVIFGDRKGQVLNHQKALEKVDTKFLWRLDDDNVAEPTALEKMLEAMEDDVGAVGGLVLHPTHFRKIGDLASNAIEDFDLGLNVQWYTFDEQKEVDHLYSTFLYRKEAGKHGYCMDLSPVGHNEETMFTYEMKRAGWRILVEPKAVTWHLRDNKGGIRSYNDEALWKNDKKIMEEKLKEWGITVNKYKFFVLDNGIGDHIVFKKVFDEKLRERYKDSTIVIGCCYPNVFEGAEVKLVSVNDMKAYYGNLDRFNIYKWMWDRNWVLSLDQAYGELYK